VKIKQGRLALAGLAVPGDQLLAIGRVQRHFVNIAQTGAMRSNAAAVHAVHQQMLALEHGDREHTIGNSNTSQRNENHGHSDKPMS
jgi:hypothetical protein